MSKNSNQPQPMDPRLLEFATDRERAILQEVLNQNGNISKAAKKLGLARGSVQDAKRRTIKRAAVRGYAPDYDLTHPSAPGMVVKGTSLRYNETGDVEQYWNKTTREGLEPEEAHQLPDPKKTVKLSTLYDAEGRITQQWVSEKPEDVARENAWRMFAEELASDLPRAEPVQAPDTHLRSDLMAAYPIGDHHMGMLAWKKESSESYDLKIGETMLQNAMDYLLEATPPCDKALVVFLGDFMHYDSFVPVTPTSRNQLDTDTRFPKMVRASVRAMRYSIESALRRHGSVHVIVEIGNHDLSSSIFLMECLHNIYENEPRITIDTSPRHYHYYRFGDVLIGTHHGHGAKMQDLPLIMATDMAADWGATAHRYIWTGHVHHSARVTQAQKDFPGVEVESFRILPPADAWASQKGYRPIRDMKGIVLHKNHGEVARHTVNPGMIRGV